MFHNGSPVNQIYYTPPETFSKFGKGFEDCDVWGSLLSDKFIKGKINTQLFSYKESFQS